MFNWDGSNVTDIISQSDIYGAKYNKNTYWIIKYTNSNGDIIEETCSVRSCKNGLSCLIDELKPIFGLIKMGTHWCVQGNKTKLLIKVNKTEEGYIKEELHLSSFESLSPIFKSQVQEIYTFRELLGVTCSYDKSIIVRSYKNNVYPVSFYEPNMVTEDKKVIPFIILNKWFEGTSIDDVVKRLVKIYSIDKMGTVLHNLRSKIDKVIERVDRRTIMYKTCIINRITERLQTTLN